MTRSLASFICGATFVGAAISGAAAQSAFHPTRVLSAPRTSGVRPFSPVGRTHAFFGTIVRLAPRAFSLRLRSGRIVTVNSEIAIAADRFSAPLFVNKIVVVRGQVDTAGTLHAESIEKLPMLDPGTAPDR